MDPTSEPVVFPEDLTSLSAEDLTALETRATAEFNALADGEDITDEDVVRLGVLADGIESVRNRRSRLGRYGRRDAMRARVTAAAVTEPDDGEPDDAATGDVGPPVETPAEPVAATTTTPTRGGARTEPRASLAAAQANAPAVRTERAGAELTITAASPTSGVQIGSSFDDVDALVAAFQSHARALAPTHGTPSMLTVATIGREYENVVDDRTSIQAVESMLSSLRGPDAIEAIVAGGGWCAPSELRYDFFNIACEDGMVDLPEFGVSRGGLRFPVSPSLADVFTGTFTNATNPWVWTETDDILTVTGSPNKPCVRVPCPSFSEARLECYGICLTAGNLTDNAYPESTRNHLRLLMSAHYHAMNQRYLSQMQTLSTFSGTVTGGGTAAGDAISSDFPTALAIAAQDVRTRFGMCDGDVLEVVVPRWVRDAIRSDLSRRSGDAAYLNMTDAEVEALIRPYRARVQWVADWQVRGAGQFGGSTPLLAWPASVDFMIYPAGTVLRGNGMSLDLGVVRDSVLNAENDFTASWTEECHLIALIGHQIRRYTVPVCVGGKVGGTYSTCHSA